MKGSRRITGSEAELFGLIGSVCYLGVGCEGVSRSLESEGRAYEG